MSEGSRLLAFAVSGPSGSSEWEDRASEAWKRAVTQPTVALPCGSSEWAAGALRFALHWEGSTSCCGGESGEPALRVMVCDGVCDDGVMMV
jgi:hypothetical protein